MFIAVILDGESGMIFTLHLMCLNFIHWSDSSFVIQSGNFTFFFFYYIKKNEREIQQAQNVWMG